MHAYLADDLRFAIQADAARPAVAVVPDVSGTRALPAQFDPNAFAMNRR